MATQGIEGAAAAALMVALALDGSTPDELYREIKERCVTRSEDFDERLEKLTDFNCVWRFPDDFERAVLTGVNTDGDSDSIATITGSIMGARLGLEAIPERWRNGVENSAGLRELGMRLSAARLDPPE